METTALSVSPTLAPLAAGKRGLKRGLRTREHTAIVMLDETIITEIPPCIVVMGGVANKFRSRLSERVPNG